MSRILFWLVAAACLVASAYIFLTKDPGTGHLVVAISLILCAVIFGCLSKILPMEARRVVAVNFLAILAAVYLVELYLTFGRSAKVQLAPLSNHDTRSKREALADLRQAGEITAVPAIPPTLFLTNPEYFGGATLLIDGKNVLPLSGISLRRTVTCNEGGYWANYFSDEHGFNNPQGLWAASPEIAVVGASNAQGGCVHAGSDWVSLIRNRFPKTLNLAMGGDGPMHELATLKEFLPSLRPQIVIFEFFEANEDWIDAEEAQPIIVRYLTEPEFQQGLTGLQKQIDNLLDLSVERVLKEATPDSVVPKFRLFSFLRMVNLRELLKLPLDNPSAVAAVRLNKLNAVLAEGKRVIEKWQGRAYFLFLPSLSGLTSKAQQTAESSRSGVLEIARQRGYEVIDVSSALSDVQDPASLFNLQRRHYNEEGYKIIAKEVVKRVSDDLKYKSP